MSSLHQVMYQTAQSWIINLNNGCFPCDRSPNAVHTVLPASLNIPSRRNNSETVDWLIAVLPGLHDYETFQVGDMPIMIDTEQHWITMHLEGAGQTDTGPYRNEYLWVLKTSEDGKLIEESWEYLDSAITLEYLSRGNGTMGS